MGVYIKDMEMPTSCPCELLGDGYDLICSFFGGVPRRVKEYYECCQNGTRPTWCPLAPVPPHGRLIDADALDASLKEMSEIEWNQNLFPVSWAYAFDAFRDIIERDEPTIIPAEEGE
jgi:hypothetical protein